MQTDDLPTDSLSLLLQAQAQTRGCAPAIISVQGGVLVYADVWRHVQRIAAVLAGAGPKTPTRVAVVLPNGPEMAVAFLGVASCAACAPLNPAFTAAEMRYHLEDTRAEAVVLSARDPGPARAAARELGLTVVEMHGFDAGDAVWQLAWASPGAASTSPRASSASPHAMFRLPLETALVLHTSGTTARPKRVPLTQRQLLASAAGIAAHLALNPLDRCLNVMPLFHIHGLVAALLASIHSGGSVVCTPGFDEVAMFDWIAQLQPSWITAVPTMHQAWAAQGPLYRQKAPGHRFRFVRSSSAALPPATLASVQALAGAPVVEAYGMTEASHQMASNPLPPGVCKPGSVGLAAGSQIAVMDEAGQVLGPGALGEIVVRGPGLTHGYEDNPEANAAAFQDGWFRTGDQGRIDDEGYLFITGRLKEIVNRGGEKISPREVDEALLEHPDVRQAAAYGVPHASLGEDLAAVVVLKVGATADETALRDFLFSRLAPYKVPSAIQLAQAIPKGATGKIQRNSLHSLLAAKPLAAASPPLSNLQRQLAGFIGEVLRTQPPGLDDNFFSLGGDSLKGTQVVSRINSSLSLALPVTVLFRRPTLSGLAREVEAALVADAAERDALAAEIENMSDEEVARMLGDASRGGA